MKRLKEQERNTKTLNSLIEVYGQCQKTKPTSICNLLRLYSCPNAAQVCKIMLDKGLVKIVRDERGTFIKWDTIAPNITMVTEINKMVLSHKSRKNYEKRHGEPKAIEITPHSIKKEYSFLWGLFKIKTS